MTNLPSLLERAKPYIVDSAHEWQERPDHEVHRLLHEIEVALASQLHDCNNRCVECHKYRNAGTSECGYCGLKFNRPAEPPAPKCNHLPLQAPWCGICNPQARVFRGNGPACLGCGKTIREHLTNYNFCPRLPENDIEHQSIGRAQNWPVDPTPPHLLKQGYRSGHVFSTHWSKDPLAPYQGCDCSTCAEVRDRGMVEVR